MWIEIILAAFAVISACTAFLFRRWVNSRISEKERAELDELIKSAVAAAEQFASLDEDFKGKAKLEYVTNLIESKFAVNGKEIFNAMELRALIESAVYALKHGG